MLDESYSEHTLPPISVSRLVQRWFSEDAAASPKATQLHDLTPDSATETAIVGVNIDGELLYSSIGNGW